MSNIHTLKKCETAPSLHQGTNTRSALTYRATGFTLAFSGDRVVLVVQLHVFTFLVALNNDVQFVFTTITKQKQKQPNDSRIQHRKLKIYQHEHHFNTDVKPGAAEG
jgi:hypothetical protein